MTFEEANEKLIDPTNTEAMSAFGCTYFHNICIKCTHKPHCYRKEMFIKGCNFYLDSEVSTKIGQGD